MPPRKVRDAPGIAVNVAPSSPPVSDSATATVADRAPSRSCTSTSRPPTSTGPWPWVLIAAHAPHAPSLRVLRTQSLRVLRTTRALHLRPGAGLAQSKRSGHVVRAGDEGDHHRDRE